ncbi:MULTISPECIES: NUDIX domain-containing protein [Bacillaceae]|uniref:NUDIX hydrolase n=1 Tax=Gottfriedia luciferensis TaxID=178774 RepID=A0ABX2ZJL9_9BACI|nr:MULTISPECIES: NUDIX domain-containing protein [Bacillaceae]ODG89878.1 NUDIX hydrolase [Gottfriedia luciferensis]PGZ94819.1 NUDIX hydrolase [Bacillus sp. AFS029533]SFC76455.1 Isopentenyldiphosphate isomerase [Bacillus sp. UNCCL81]
MKEELLKIFDESGNHIGEASRSEVHKKGLWHETFHCWLLSIIDDQASIYFQIRSHQKKDYPNLFDITAAGHLLSTETVQDGLREVKEELGIEVKMEDVIPLGIIKNSIILETIIDHELSHVFLLKSDKPFTDFNLQKEEVSGIVKADFNQFYQFAHGLRDTVEVDGFQITETEEKIPIQKSIDKDQFVSHESNYLLDVVELIKNHIHNEF